MGHLTHAAGISVKKQSATKPKGRRPACTFRMLVLAPPIALRPRPVSYAGAGGQPTRGRLISLGGISIPDFVTFFEKNYWPMVRSLTAAFGDAAAVEEAVQDAFIRANTRWRRVGRYDSPAAWVRRVAINRLKDHRRSAFRRAAAETRAAVDESVRSAVEAPAILDGAAAMLAALPERQRTAMALFYVEDLSVREIASSMKISDGAVKAHLSQGRAKLAQLTEPEPEAEAEAEPDTSAGAG